MNLVKRIIKRAIPYSFYNMAYEVKLRLRLFYVRLNHILVIKKLRKKGKIKVAFFLIEGAAWKLEKLFQYMQKSSRFDPIIILCPYIMHGHEVMIKTFNRAEKALNEKGQPFITTYNSDSNSWLDVRKQINPDLIFFTNPWNITRPEYQIGNYLNLLTCYVPYGFETCHLNEAYFNQLTQVFVWRFFLETTIHQRLSRIYALNKGRNTLVTGYPGMDILLDKEHKPIDVWKIKNNNIKRIIWAPHHTIPGFGDALDYSTFMDYYEYMFEIANKFNNQIQIAFKPHPILRAKLSKPEVWGREKTDKYYNSWEELYNGQLNETDYIDLFLKSDAMIHDSGSFVIEYLYTSKPVMFLAKDDAISDRFNEIGKAALKVIYLGKSKVDIETFINDVVINGEDNKSNDRIAFFEGLVRPPNGLSASENIFRFLNSQFLGG